MLTCEIHVIDLLDVFVSASVWLTMPHWQFNSFTNTARPEGRNVKRRMNQYSFRMLVLTDSISFTNASGEKVTRKRLYKPSQWLCAEWGRLPETPVLPVTPVTSYWETGQRGETLLLLHCCWMVLDARAAWVWTRVHPPPVTFSPGFRTQRPTLHKITTLKTAGPDPHHEIVHSQSHGHTVEKCVSEGGWRMGFDKWNKGHAPVSSYQHSIMSHDL